MMPGWRSTNGADVLYVTNHGGRQANSGISNPSAAARGCPGSRVHSGDVRRRHTQCHRPAVIALALGATAVGYRPGPTPTPLSYGGAESLTHYLKAFLAELGPMLGDLRISRDIASLKEAGCEQALTFQ